MENSSQSFHDEESPNGQFHETVLLNEDADECVELAIYFLALDRKGRMATLKPLHESLELVDSILEAREKCCCSRCRGA
eukprot:CAMPEP_0197592720 /NCGR_PEP_ID=MMETSP1326-20131121/15371_1 /TAXON_ID=1155430 /ORGANISM="Genus nov. species nov., Strain RCC2288" /LENGTH=78 /DNA_ID=CAMNT_0043158455 /DNA_START=436 /DNA_END=672 /DNA_ORIENTATION=-